MDFGSLSFLAVGGASNLADGPSSKILSFSHFPTYTAKTVAVLGLLPQALAARGESPGLEKWVQSPISVV